VLLAWFNNTQTGDEQKNPKEDDDSILFNSMPETIRFATAKKLKSLNSFELVSAVNVKS